MVSFQLYYQQNRHIAIDIFQHLILIEQFLSASSIQNHRLYTQKMLSIFQKNVLNDYY